MDAPRPAFRAIVDEKFKNELDVYAAARGKSNIHESLSGAADQISVSYKGRTLIELIQNAYDPHSSSLSDGKISILFDVSEGTYGCLYVANRGAGFSRSNFEGLCDIARSSKVVNQGIGNKGFGFRSVRQICRYPEIYSSDPDSPPGSGFDGFCFRFPSDNQLGSFLSGTEHASYVDEVISTVPRLLLPIFSDERPGHVPLFADQGFATVIRMPLDRSEAATDIRDQIDAICDHELPIHLFLDRISEIGIEVRDGAAGAEDECYARILPREVLDRWTKDDVHFEIVRVNEEAEYLVSKYRLPDEEFRPVLEAGVEAEELPESWSDWRDPAEISVAVRLGSSGQIGRLYNFLPMEAVAESPCAAHINAPFYCDIDRKKLVDNVKLNDYFLKSTAALCLRSAEDIKESKPNLAPQAVLDLTMWGNDATAIMVDVAKEQTGKALQNLPLIPTSAGSSRFPWSTIVEAYEWPGDELDLTVVAPQTMARVAQVDFLDATIRSERRERVIQVARYTTELELSPTAEATAVWIERFAADLHERTVSIDTWNGFYQDLTALFSDSPEALRNRKILLAEDNKLAPTLAETSSEEATGTSPRRPRRVRRAVFLPSARPQKGAGAANSESAGEDNEPEYEDAIAANIPRSLERVIRVVNQNLGCAARNDATGVRQFLIENRLVNQFLTEDIQRLLGRVTAYPGSGKSPDKRRMEALRFAFELSERGTRTAELTEMPFHVPTRSNDWVRATRAHFGPSWPGTRGKELAELVTATQNVSEDLRAVGENTLRDLPEWEGLTKLDGRDWSRFLRSLGVRDTLQVTNVRPPGPLQEQGHLFKTRLLVRCSVSGEARTCWADDLHADLPNPYTPYTVRGAVPALPGQSDFQDFKPSARLLYAREILACVQEAGGSPLTILVFRPEHPFAPNERAWPSPLASFLRHAKWLPVQSPDPETDFARPAEAWHLPLHATNVRPEFLTTVANDCRSFLEAHPELQELLQDYCDLNIVNSLGSSTDQVQLLGKLALDGQVPSGSMAAFDSLYSEGWKRLAEDAARLDAFLDTPPFFVAAHAGAGVVGYELTADEDSEEAGPNATATPLAYLADDKSPTTRDLLKELDRPVFDFKFAQRADVCAQINKTYPQLELISNVQLDVLVGGSPFHPREEDPLLSPMDRRWLQDTILVICDLLAGALLNLGPEAFDRLRARISRLRYRLVEDITLQIDGQTVPLPEFAQGSLFVNDDARPTLLIKTAQDELSWGVLQQASHAVAEGLGYPVHLSSVLSSAFAQLSLRHSPDALSRPSETDLRAVCRKSGQAVRESLRNLRQVIESLIELARPLILSIGGRSAAQRFEGLIDSIEGETDLEEVLQTLRADLPLAPDALLSACIQNDDLDGVRKDLGIGMPEFNAAIRELGPPYREINYAKEHAQQFKAFVTAHRDVIQDALRSAHKDPYEGGRDLSDYVDASGLDGLAPDPDWATSCDALSEHLMTARVNSWLAKYKAGPIDNWAASIPLSVAECRTSNRDSLRRFVSDGWAIVSAWCRKNERQAPARWLTRHEAPQALVTHAQESGCLDFKLLDTAGLIKWLKAGGDWPEGMPETLDLKDLDLDAESVDATAEEARQEKAERARLARIVNVGGQELSADQEDLPEALNLLVADYSQQARGLDAPAKIVPLEKLDLPSKDGKSRSGVKSSKSALPRDMPEAQKKIIGLLGERLAFDWLLRQYPSAVNEESWVSTNRERAIQLAGGDDSLGYDFVVNLPSYTLYFEVKATSGDDFFFRLGPTEVEAAVQFRADSKHRFRILLIQNVLDPAAVKMLPLPNPYSSPYRDRFRLVTRGEQGFRFVLGS